MKDALQLMNPKKRYCACGCGELLVQKPKEEKWDFEKRKYTGYQCAIRARVGKKVTNGQYNYVPKTEDRKTIHPLINKFLYPRLSFQRRAT